MPKVVDAVVTVGVVADADGDALDPGGGIEEVADEVIAADGVEVYVPVD